MSENEVVGSQLKLVNRLKMRKTKTKEKALQDELFAISETIKNGTDDSNITSKYSNLLGKHLGNLLKYSATKKPSKKAGINSGLKKPVRVSTEMSDFASWPHDEEHSRVDVTNIICRYIDTHDLQNPKNRRSIILDEPLGKLLKYTEPEITYPHIQKYINVHFPKPLVDPLVESLLVNPLVESCPKELISDDQSLKDKTLPLIKIPKSGK